MKIKSKFVYHEADCWRWKIVDRAGRTFVSKSGFESQEEAEVGLAEMVNKLQKEARRLAYRAKVEAYKSLGLKRVHGALGGVYWE